ncbi:dispanin subfamily A member 2b-like [Mugil cephalus]|uniref:dispanin subfamily A member 2b-like n=1 Tax=Mugil cephalus TaxID=48193 RepID=UPI001FB6104E|nr:dispanin subfamily A member 2b-like [Mugil cephalus]
MNKRAWVSTLHQLLNLDIVQQNHNRHPLKVKERFTMETGKVQATVPTYLGWSIFNTLCCCLPLGIAAIIFSCKAQNANLLGQATVARDASRSARVLNIFALVCGIVLIIIYVVLITGL